MIDWNGNLEAVHVSGRVCPAERFSGGDHVWPDNDGQYHVGVDEGEEWQTLTFANEDGSAWDPCKWTIRNAASEIDNEEENDIVDQLRGRALFLRNKGEQKTPGLMERAADRIEWLRNIPDAPTA